LSFLAQLSPSQRKLLTYGVPVVVLLGLFALLRSRSKPALATTATSVTNPSGTAVIDAGQLASFENTITQQLGAFQSQLNAPAGSIPLGPPVASPTPAPIVIGTAGLNVPGVQVPPGPAPAQTQPFFNAASALEQLQLDTRSPGSGGASYGTYTWNQNGVNTTFLGTLAQAQSQGYPG
jgi:hypothetical protein